MCSYCHFLNCLGVEFVDLYFSCISWILEKNIGRTLNDINQSKILCDPPPRVMEIKTKVKKWNLIKLKSFCFCKGNYKQGGKTSLRMGKNDNKWNNWQRINFQNIQAAHTTQYQKDKQPKQEVGKRLKQTFLQRRYTWLTNTWKHAQHHSLLEKCKSKLQWDISSHQAEWSSSKSLETINAGEGVEKRERSCIVGGNVNWYSHNGRWYGDSLKNEEENHRMTQQSHSQAYTLRKPKLKKTHVSHCSLQHYLQQLERGSDLAVHRRINGREERVRHMDRATWKLTLPYVK